MSSCHGGRTPPKVLRSFVVSSRELSGRAAREGNAAVAIDRMAPGLKARPAPRAEASPTMNLARSARLVAPAGARL
jgi:hypothetical protein